jgi:hypothetical protein
MAMSELGVDIRVAVGFYMPCRSRCFLEKQAVGDGPTLNADIAKKSSTFCPTVPA